jgi:MEMO1 family protein
MIKSSFAGKFYESDYVKLMGQIDSSYEHDLGPGDLPTRRKEGKLHGIIVPHDHYNLSGPCASWGYKLLAEHKFPETFVILVPDQSNSLLNYATTLEDFETEFGICKVDKEFAKKLVDSGIVTKKDSIVEQALEVQLPFLMHACKDKIKDVKVLPLVVPHTHNFEALANEIVSSGKDIVVIVASNFTKYGPKFLFTPFKYNLKESLNQLDRNIVKSILNLDSETLIKHVRRNKIQISGVNAIAMALTIFKLMEIKEGELLSFYRSSKIDEDLENFISYMSFVF